MTRTTPVELDMNRIDAALRTLAHAAWEKLLAKGGTLEAPPPNTAATEIGGLIADPMAAGITLAHRALHRYLTQTIGAAAANEMTSRITTECMPKTALPPADAARH